MVEGKPRCCPGKTFKEEGVDTGIKCSTETNKSIPEKMLLDLVSLRCMVTLTGTIFVKVEKKARL